jgi:uncharacterized protein YegJ (DUF2314 family)
MITPAPTNLIVPWPDREPPRRDDLLARLDAELLEPIDSGDPSIAWCAAVRGPTLPAPLLLWVEPARGPLPETLGVNAPGPWVVGIETLLDVDDPLDHLARLMRVVLDARADVGAVLDVNTSTWYPRPRLDDLFGGAGDAPPIEPPADVLWIIRAVAAEDGATVWLSTHGLDRCGTPDLEMLEVPAAHAGAAADLLGAVAALALERPLPAPGARFEIGPDLAVAFQPWPEVAPYVSPPARGGPADRADDAPAPGGPGAALVVCATRPAGAYRPLWVWPRDVVERLERDETCVYLTARATTRQTLLAQREWDAFAATFAATRAADDAARDPRVDFGVKAGFTAGDDETSREHLWFEVERVEPDGAEGVLVHAPRTVPGLATGDRRWIERGDVSDWRVVTAEASFGPATAREMHGALGSAS